MSKLIKMSDYVLEKNEDRPEAESPDDFNGRIANQLGEALRYAEFLHQKLADRYQVNGVSAHPLNRFVPCDLEGNVLEKPHDCDCNGEIGNIYQKECSMKCEHDSIYNLRFREALDRVIFEGSEMIDDDCISIKGKGAVFIKNHIGMWLPTKGIKTIEDLCSLGLTFRDNK